MIQIIFNKRAFSPKEKEFFRPMKLKKIFFLYVREFFFGTLTRISDKQDFENRRRARLSDMQLLVKG